MTYSLKYIGIGALGAVALLIMFGAYISTVNANPPTIQRVSTAGAGSVATTTLVYLTPGTGTTTLVLDTKLGASTGMDSAVLLVQQNGSSSVASTLNIAFEYAPDLAGVDCVATPTACSWYKDNLLGDRATVGTTTSLLSVNTANSYTMLMSSSTVGGLAGNSLFTTKAFTVSVPTRYVRAVFTVPSGSLNSGIYAEFDAKKQNP